MSAHVTFYPLERTHFPLLVRWLNTQHVHLIWGGHERWTPVNVAQKYGSYVDGYAFDGEKRRPIFAYVFAINGKLAGFIQCYDAYDFDRMGYQLGDIFDLEDFPSLGALDFYLGETSLLGKGWGAKVVREFLLHFVWKKFRACFVDPDPANALGIKAFAGAGFIELDVPEDICIVPMLAKAPVQTYV